LALVKHQCGLVFATLWQRRETEPFPWEVDVRRGREGEQQ
jgi:hypothetical protein